MLSIIWFIVGLMLANCRSRRVNDTILDYRLLRFRRKIERQAARPSAFRTLYHVGYKLRAAVEDMLGANASR